MIKIEIDGKQIEAEPGKMIIQVADQHSIAIPRFCYHQKLSIAANCRMCLVQVDKSPKPLPACATPIAEGMKIWTASALAKEAQSSVMEFLLINHPLDCPICDQGGECELQDVSMTYGKDFSRYDEPKRAVLDQNLGPLIATEMTRCIQCTRCVRFGAEISGERELGATGRGEDMKIETFVAQHVNSEVSGNVIDICPVGALTSKPFRFKARAWELQEAATIAPHDCIGSNIYLHLLRDEVMRVVPREAECINEIWLSDRDRFSYEALYHAERLRKPMIHKNNKWQMVSWIEALKYAIAGVKLSNDKYGAEHLGVLANPSSTLEEFYLLQKLTRDLGSANIDHRLRQLDFRDQDSAPQFPNLGVTLEELEKLDLIILIGSEIHKEQPLAGLKLRKMVKNGGTVCAINPVAFSYNFDVALQETVVAGNLLQSIAAIAKEILRLTNTVAAEEAVLLENIVVTPLQQQIAAKIYAAKNSLIILGPHVLMHPNLADIRSWTNLIAKILHCRCGEFSEGANSSGAWLAGCVPHRSTSGAPAEVIGKNALQMLQNPLRAYILFGIEPNFDSLLGLQAIETLRGADFVVAVTAYQSDILLEIADVLLPMALFAENSGTYINVVGKWQTFEAACEPYGESRPGWKILRVLGNLADLNNFDYQNPQQIRDLLFESLPEEGRNTNVLSLDSWTYTIASKAFVETPRAIVRIAPISLYSIDPIVRRAQALQKTKDAIQNPTIELSENTARQLGITDGDEVYVSTIIGRAKLPVNISSRVPDFTAVIYQAHPTTNVLGAPYSIVEVKT